MDTVVRPDADGARFALFAKFGRNSCHSISQGNAAGNIRQDHGGFLQQEMTQHGFHLVVSQCGADGVVPEKRGLISKQTGPRSVMRIWILHGPGNATPAIRSASALPRDSPPPPPVRGQQAIPPHNNAAT